ncbi:hypothetical protein RUM44_006493 [Polyplax serrata]|uniref:Uncharacterized protein n=1 Tax=Polyplax serrata TaxID=468196 RepID=A0ABR1AIB8_POLSC
MVKQKDLSARNQNENSLEERRENGNVKGRPDEGRQTTLKEFSEELLYRKLSLINFHFEPVRRERELNENALQIEILKEHERAFLDENRRNSILYASNRFTLLSL